MNAAHSLPFDIHEAIIDQCQDDPELLSICALICRDWLERSYLQQFREITIRTRRQVYDLRDVFSLNGRLASRVRTISIQPSHPESPLRIPSLSDLAAMTLLPLLANLRTWTFSSSVGGRAHSGHPLRLTHTALRLLQRAHEKTGHNVAALELHRLTLASYPELVRIAQRFPQLRHLRCSEIDFVQPVDASLSLSALGELPLLSLKVSHMDTVASFMLLDLVHTSTNKVTTIRLKIDGLDLLTWFPTLVELSYLVRKSCGFTPRLTADEVIQSASKWAKRYLHRLRHPPLLLSQIIHRNYDGAEDGKPWQIDMSAF